MFHCTCLVTTNKHLSFRLNAKTGPISVILSFNSTHKAANKIIPFNCSQCREEGGCSVSSYLPVPFPLITLHYFYFPFSLISPHNFLSFLSFPPFLFLFFFTSIFFLSLFPFHLLSSSHYPILSLLFLLTSLCLPFFTYYSYIFYLTILILFVSSKL